MRSLNAVAHLHKYICKRRSKRFSKEIDPGRRLVSGPRITIHDDMDPIAAILKAYSEGNAALLVTGRSLYDFVADESRLRTLLEVLRRELFRHHGMLLVTYSLANGIQWFEDWVPNEKDRSQIREAFRSSRLLEAPPGSSEVVSVVRGISNLSRANLAPLKWQDGRPMRFAFCLEFCEHLAPSLANGTQTDSQVIVTELMHVTAQSLALRDSGNLILFHGRYGMIDELVCAALKNVHLRQPSETEKASFVRAALELYTDSAFEPGLSTEAVISLTVNTPNRGIENLLRASHRGKRQLLAKDIAEQKNRDVVELSENTLRPMDITNAGEIKLVGRNIMRPQAMLLQMAELLLQGNTSMPSNVILAGTPGAAKSDLAKMVALNSKVPAYELLSPKGSLVGETERKARLQQQALRDWSPNISISDELTEALPMQRGEFDGDSGASRAVTATLLSALADESRRGRSLLIGTTNRPWAIGAAMRSRFVVLPVLFPLKQDFPAIIVSTAQRIVPGSQLEETEPEVIEAAEVFYTKGASPRHIRSALSNAHLLSGKSDFDSETVLIAARDLCASTDFDSSIYADLWALKCCTSRSFLPWSCDIATYPFPEYLRGIVDERTGDIRETALNSRINELKSSANV